MTDQTMTDQTRIAPKVASRYLRILLLVALGGLPLVAAFCCAMDAYRVFGAPLRPGWNDVKRANNERLAFAYELRREAVATLLLGSSRLRAFDETHPALAPGPVGVIRLAGTDIWEIEHFFHHALAVAPIRRGMLLLDFVNFNAMGPATRARPDYLVGPRGDPRDWRLHLAALGPVLFSLDGLEAATATLLASVRSDAPRDARAEQGLTPGTRHIFRLTERMFAREGGIYTPGLTATYSFEDARRGDTSFEPFERILAAAHRHDVDLRLVVSPSHARMWQVLHSLGLWPEWEEWKRRIVAANVRIAAEQGRTPFPLWDFSGFNSITTEPVPPPDGAPMRYYEETSHFTRAVGDMVLRRVFGPPPPEAVAEDFGVALTPEALDAHLEAIRSARDAWQRAHPEEIREVEATIL